MLVLAGVGVALYFCWPRGIPPKVEVVSYDVEGAAQLQAVYPYYIRLPVTIRINVTSEMMIGIPLDSIVSEGFYTPAGSGTKVKVAGGVLSEIYFAPQTTTTLRVPFDVNYTAENLGDPVISSLLADCNIASAGGSGKIRIDWTATVVAKLFTFIRFSFSGSNDIDCPANSIGDSLVTTAKQVLGRLGIPESEVPSDPTQLLDYLKDKAESLGIVIPEGADQNILALASAVAQALGYDLGALLENWDGDVSSVFPKIGG
jgi:hypothetical protein